MSTGYSNTKKRKIAESMTLTDLIELGKSISVKRRKRQHGENPPFNTQLLRDIIPCLEELNRLVGMSDVKEMVVKQIVYFLSGLHDGKLDMLHTVITGSPGVGKTELAKLLANIFLRMGILNNDTLVIAKRNDLIAKYLGQTADKTQKLINSCKGGVLLIDEAYQLGCQDKQDSYSKECLDILNQNLTENKNDFMCIIVGYKDALEECFFAVNEGLRRRFSFTYDIAPYTPFELRLILMKIIFDQGWSIKTPIEKQLPLDFFISNMPNFKNYGGDMETLFFHIKLSYGLRVFINSITTNREIESSDLTNGMVVFIKNRQSLLKDGFKSPPDHMYI